MVQIGEFQRIFQKEDRCVVSDQIPVPLFSIKLHRKTADIALGIGRTTFTGDRRKTHEHLGLFSDLRKDLRLCVSADIVGNSKGSKSSRPFRMHTSLGNHLAIETGKLLLKPDILHQQRPARSGSDDIIVINHRCPGIRRQLFFHDFSPL